MAYKLIDSFSFLNSFRGTFFSGEWPTVSELFLISRNRFPNSPFFTDFEGSGGSRQTLTYNQVYENASRLASWLIENGLEKGDRIAVTGKNSPEWGTAFLAGFLAGSVVCPMDYGLSEKELENLIATAKPKFVFADEEKLPHFEKSADFRTISLSCKKNPQHLYNLCGKKIYENRCTNENDLAVILFTSGTTGNPKGVMLTHKNLVSDSFIAQTRMKIYQSDVFYALLPIHHAYTLQAVFMVSLSQGCEIVFGKSMAVTRLLKELKEGKITMLLGVPLLFNKLLAGIMKGIKSKGPVVNAMIHFLMGLSYFIKKVFKKNPGKVLFKSVLDKASISSLRIAICGGGPLASSVFKVYNEMGIDFVQGYGLTETSPIIALNPVNHFKIESVGQYFYPYMEMKIFEPDEKGVGEVLVKGPMVFGGYYKMEEETKKVFDADGFFKTGDLGYLDKEGYLVLCGRAKNMIVTDGGKNVYPEEIENEFQLCSDISQITVQGYVEDPESKAEKIEALIYVSDDLYSRLNLKREDGIIPPEVDAAVRQIISSRNKNARGYDKIEKITILETPLEMTTTQKVKRHYNK